MVQQLTPETKPEIIYRDSDGEPMSDNTKQFRWIVTIKENLEILFASILPKLNNNGSVHRKRQLEPERERYQALLQQIQ